LKSHVAAALAGTWGGNLVSSAIFSSMDIFVAPGKVTVNENFI